METVTTTWSEFPNGGKAIVEEILASEEINKSKRGRTVRITVLDPSRKINYPSKVIWDKVIWDNRVHQIYQFHQNKKFSPYDGR